MRSLIPTTSLLLLLSLLIFPAFTYGATYVVDNAANTDNLAIYTAGDGTNTLRKCIRLANLNPGLDNINFNLPGAGPYIITTAAPVLAVTSPLFLDGFSQPGASPGNLLVQLTAGSGLDLLQFNLNSDGSTIQGMNIYGPGCTAIRATNSSGHTIIGNYLGTNLAGTAAGSTPVMQNCINLSGATNCVIGGTGGVATRNIISGSTQRGIYLQNLSHGAVIQGNYIGTNVLGTVAIPNVNGIEVNNSNTPLIGGASYNAKNIIAGNTTNGILIATCSAPVIKGNFVGIGKNGTTAIPNGQHGVFLQTSSSSVVIGGLATAERNIISGNGQRAISVTNANGLTIQNNYIGLDSTGMLLVANGQNGMEINSCTNILIGGSTYSAKNIVCGSINAHGIYMNACNTSIVVKGNFIGVAKDGITAYGNKNNGLQITNTTATPVTVAITVGGPLVEERNVIASNTAVGVSINSGTNVTVQNNYIGVDSTGMLLRANTQNALEITNSSNIIVGGGYATRNIVCGSVSGHGIYINSCSNSVVVKGNLVGVAKDGVTAYGHRQNGLQISSSSTAITVGGPLLEERNIISSNTGRGILVNAGTSVTIQNNYIGVDSTGLLLRANTLHGMEITGSSNIVIGGGYRTRNIVCGSINGGNHGISVNNCTTSVTVKGNFIGIAKDGTTAYGNRSNGLQITNTSAPITVGGPLLEERNIISANTGLGALITGATSVTVQNNYIGTDSTGMLLRANTQNSLEINGSTNVLVGGGYATRNIICGSISGHGISMSTCSTSVVVKGNFIGIAKDGTTGYGNRNGLQIQTSSPVTVGGPLVEERNIISANTSVGLYINNGTNVTIQNNYVGVDTTGLLLRANIQNSIELSNCNNIVVGGGYSTKNIVCGSVNGHGIALNTCSTSVVVKGNFIGIAKDGTTAYGNKNNGLQIGTSLAIPITVGGPLPEERNIIASNGAIGLQVNNGGVVTIQNNYIGTDSTGMNARGNGQYGMTLSNNATLTLGGSTTNLRNLVSANRDGIQISQTPVLIVRANYVGVAIDGVTPMGNTQRGILVQTSPGALIGGALLAERNIVSNNGQQGLEVNNSAGSIVYNNYIGVDATGIQNQGNGQNGLICASSANLIIGGGSSATRNIISGNRQAGIRINGNCPNAIIRGNFCGIGSDGVTKISNAESGIYFGGSGSNGAVVGGSAFMDRNVCSGNGYTTSADSRDGIRFEGGSGNHVVKGNYCGVDSTGTIVIGNTWAGISLNETTDCIVGGTGTYEGNISSGNENEGVYFRNAVRTTFIGNYIGTDKTGTMDLGNQDYGINIRFTSLDNTIGGTTIAERNIIAYTKGIAAGSGVGVYVELLSQRNKIVRNNIHCNATKGIFLEAGANEGIAAPIALLSDVNAVNGTGSIDGDSIHVYYNPTSGGFCDCEGEVYLGGTVVSGGTWSFTHNLGLTSAQTERITATETTVNRSTSPFSDCIIPLPIELVTFTATKQSENTALVSWTTAMEENNYSVEVQRSTDGIHFQTVAIILGQGNSTTLKNYSILDTEIPGVIVYYKLKQTDLDGTVSYSKIVSLDFSNASLSVYQTEKGFTLVVPTNNVKEQAAYEVYSVAGVLVAQGTVPAVAGKYEIPLELSPAMYIVHAFLGNTSVTQKIIKQ